MNPSNKTSMEPGRPKRGVPEGLWMRCPGCKATLFRKEVETRHMVCPECQYHFYMPACDRIRQLLDPDSFEEWFTGLRPRDPLGFKDRVPYAERIRAEQAKTGLADAAVAMELGCDGVITNTAIAEARNPVMMAHAMKLAVEAGRVAYLAGRMPKTRSVSSSVVMSTSQCCMNSVIQRPASAWLQSLAR